MYAPVYGRPLATVGSPVRPPLGGARVIGQHNIAVQQAPVAGPANLSGRRLSLGSHPNAQPVGASYVIQNTGGGYRRHSQTFNERRSNPGPATHVGMPGSLTYGQPMPRPVTTIAAGPATYRAPSPELVSRAERPSSAQSQSSARSPKTSGVVSRQEQVEVPVGRASIGSSRVGPASQPPIPTIVSASPSRSGTQFVRMAMSPHVEVKAKKAEEEDEDPNREIDTDLCGECEEERASVYCEQCRENYCDRCSGGIHRKGRRRQHSIVPIPFEEPAPLPPQEESPAPDDVELARIARAEKAEAREAFRVQMQYTEIRTSLRDKLVGLRDGKARLEDDINQLGENAESITKESERLKDNIHNKIQVLRDALNRKEATLVAGITKVEKDKLAQLSDRSAEQTRTLTAVSGLIEDGTELLDVETSKEFLARYQQWEHDFNKTAIGASVPSEKFSVTLQQIQTDLQIDQTLDDLHELEQSTHIDEAALDKKPVGTGDLECEYTLQGHPDYVSALALCGNELVSASRSGGIRVWNLDNYEMYELSSERTAVTSLLSDTEREILFAGCSNDDIAMYDLRKFQKIGTLTGHAGHVLAVEMAGSYLVSASHDRTIKVWDLETQSDQCLATLEGHAAAVTCLAVQRQFVYSGSNDRTIKVWDLEAFQCVNTWTAHDDYVRALAVNLQWLYSASNDQSIKVWNNSTFECVAALGGHTAAVRVLILSGPHMFSGSDDNTIKVWDLVNLEEVQTLDGHKSSVTSLVYEHGRLISGSRDKSIKLWAH